MPKARGALTVLPDAVDVLIAGASAAGLAAALALITHKATVVLVEAQAPHGTRFRPEALTSPAFFEHLRLEPRQDWIRDRVEQPQGGLVLCREAFERDVLRLVQERGGTVALGAVVSGVGPFDGQTRAVTVTSANEKKRVRARCVIAADGFASTVARQAGLNTYLPPEQVAAGVICRLSGALLKHSSALAVEPISARYRDLAHRFCVCPSGPNTAIAWLLLPAVDGFRALRLLDQKLEQTALVRGGEIQLRAAALAADTVPLTKPYDDGLLLVGDAARLCHPVSFAGLLSAVMSGQAAAEVVAALGERAATAEHLGRYRRQLEPLYERLADARLGRFTAPTFTAVVSEELVP